MISALARRTCFIPRGVVAWAAFRRQSHSRSSQVTLARDAVPADADSPKHVARSRPLSPATAFRMLLLWQKLGASTPLGPRYDAEQRERGVGARRRAGFPPSHASARWAARTAAGLSVPRHGIFSNARSPSQSPAAVPPYISHPGFSRAFARFVQGPNPQPASQPRPRPRESGIWPRRGAADGDSNPLRRA